MSDEVNLDIVESFLTECNIEEDSEICLKTNGLTKNAIENLLKMYYKQEDIIKNIREEILKYDWINSNKAQIYNQLKSLFEAAFCKKLDDANPLFSKNKRKEYSKKYYEKHKEERKAYQRKYQREHYKPKNKE